MVADAAKRVSFQWPEHITQDDLAQGVITRLLESPGAVERFHAEDEPTQKAFLIRMAHQVASEEQVDYDRFSGNCLYDTAVVRGLLERQGWYYATDTWRPEISDLAEGLDSLKRKESQYWACIIHRFELEERPEPTDQTTKRRIRRAVSALTREMNLAGRNRQRRRIEGPGTRKVVSNLAARHRSDTDSGYERVSYLR